MAKKDQRMLLSGNEAVARGAWEAGALVATSYPGTPATEILEACGEYPEIDAEWSVNEKVALEVAVGNRGHIFMVAFPSAVPPGNRTDHSLRRPRPLHFPLSTLPFPPPLHP